MTPMSLFIVMNVIVFILSIALIIHGKKNIDISKSLAPERKKTNLVYRVVSMIHMCMGLFVITCYLIAGGLYLLF